MTRTIKIILILFIFLLNIYGVVFATDVNMNLVDESTLNEIYDEGATDDTTDLSDLESPSDADAELLSPTDVGGVEEEGLSLTNILSILLIAVGVVLILLAIAIIIRLK